LSADTKWIGLVAARNSTTRARDGVLTIAAADRAINERPWGVARK
jgi:hypothetical protein